MISPIGSQKYRKILIFLLLLNLASSQIYLFIKKLDDSHFDYITKSLKETM
jgi:hypothetical protein